MSRTSRWPTGSLAFIFTAALCLLLAPAAVGGQLLCDGVVLDAGVAYAMNPAGGIDAVELASGEVRWTSAAAAKPLHLSEGMLIAQGEAAASGAVDLAVLAAASGARQHGMTVSLPAGVWAGVDDRPGRSFRCHAGGSVSELVVAWSESRAVDTRFAVPAPALDEVSGPVVAPAIGNGSLSGAATLDLLSGSMTPIDAAQLAAASPSAPAHQHGVFLAGVEGRQRLSADGAHVLVSVRTGDPGDWRKYEWSIYTARGELLGSLSHHLASAPFAVAGSTLVFRDQPFTRVVDGDQINASLSLRGIDLVSGEELWSRPLRDTAYRGPFQP